MAKEFTMHQLGRIHYAGGCFSFDNTSMPRYGLIFGDQDVEEFLEGHRKLMIEVLEFKKKWCNIYED